MESFLYIAILGITILLLLVNTGQAADDINEDTAGRLFDQGTEYFRLGNYIKAKECHERALAIREKTLGEEHPDTANSLNSLGAVYSDLGDYANAKECHKRALAIREKALDEEHLNTAISLNNLGVVYNDLRDCTKAKECFERALTILKKALGEEHPDTANSLNNLGTIYSNLGDYAKAKECHERVLTIRKKALGEEHLDTAISLSNLGIAYNNLGDYAKAKECYERALSIREKTLGEEHPDTANSLDTLGTIYSYLGDYAKAEEYHERALAIHEKALGEEHPDTATSLSNLGTVYSYLGDYAKAKECYERALAIREKALGEEHPDTANSLNNLGTGYSDLGDYAKAKEYFERALAIREKALGEEHPNIVISLGNLGTVYSYLGDYAKTKECRERALAICEKSLGGEHPHTATSLNNLGVTYRDLGDYTKAKECHERALAICEKSLGGEHPHTANSLSNLGTVYGNLGDYAKAKECHEHALAICEKALGGKHPDTAVSVSNLGEICRETGANYTAIFYKKLGINILQSIRGSLTGLDKYLQKSFIRSKESHYHSLADILAEQGRLSEAQQVLAMLKEEEFFDFVRRDAKDDPRVSVASYAGLERAQAERFKEIGGQLFALTREKEKLLLRGKTMPYSEWNASDDAKRLSKIENNLELAGEVFQSFLTALEKELEKEASSDHMKEVAKMNLDAVQGLSGTLAAMGHGAVLIHTIITETRIWVILTTPEIQIAEESPISRKDLFGKILAFREDIENRRNVLPAAKELYDILIAPIAVYLKEARAQTLMISLDGQLRYIPIAALHDGEKWLAEKYAIVIYTEAAKDKLICRRDMPEWKAAAMGTTEEHPGFIALPAVKSELESIIRTEGNSNGIPGKILLDNDFTKEAFSGALHDGFPVVHIASHFRFEPGTVEDSFLLLGNGEHLTLHTMSTANFKFQNVDQMTLSACNTAIGSEEWGGREVEGFGVLAQKRGTKSVIATLWNVEDSSTGIFMSRFYNLIQQEGLTKAEAARQAQYYFIKVKVPSVPLMDSVEHAEAMPPDLKGYRHPYFWAPFILMGNWL
jgi:tetratricopeptide (TPR) repeat protein